MAIVLLRSITPNSLPRGTRLDAVLAARERRLQAEEDRTSATNASVIIAK